MKAKIQKAKIGIMLFSFYVAIACAGCAEIAEIIEPAYTSEFEPIKVENGYEYFRFKAMTNAWRPNPLKNEEGERKRIKKLENWLAKNGYSNVEYEIISRKPILMAKDLALGTEIYHIYYEIRVKESERK